VEEDDEEKREEQELEEEEELHTSYRGASEELLRSSWGSL